MFGKKTYELGDINAPIIIKIEKKLKSGLQATF